MSDNTTVKYNKDTSIRDENGKWVNSKVFSEACAKFRRNKDYCLEPIGSPDYINYWTSELDRCKNGYEVGGHKITGHHYEYLNYTLIQKVVQVKSTKASKKITDFPDFWDGDYDYYWCLDIAKNGLLNIDSLASTKLEKEIAETLDKDSRQELNLKVLDRLQLRVKPHPDFLEGGNHMTVGKCRRKGYSYKNAAICTNTYNTVRNSTTIIGAFDKKYLYPEGTMGMCTNQLNFLNKYTAWSKAREYVDKQEHRRASFKETINGTEIETGYMSNVLALTFQDNPDAARGKDSLYTLFEEAGNFPNLLAALKATAPGLSAGAFITGQILIFGTGGDMNSGTVDFADIFYHPIENGMMPFLNIWDEDAQDTYCGFFHPVYINMEGFYDEQGNSDIEGAKQFELNERKRLLESSSGSNILQGRVQEYPLCPAEAFLTVSFNDFPVIELQNQLNKVIRENLHIKYGQPVYLTRETINTDKDINQINNNPITEISNQNNPSFLFKKGEHFKYGKKYKIVATPDLNNELEPIWKHHPDTKNLKGSVVIYEAAINNAPKGLYKIGFDPYRQVTSNDPHPSLAAIYVYKGVHVGSYYKNTIVASYIGRPSDPDYTNRIAEFLAEYYNAEIMYENEVTHTKSYFEKKKKLHLLSFQPDAVISAAVKNSRVARVYGCHMNDKLKDAGEKYIKKWLLEEKDIDEDGNTILNLETIYDPGLLEELIKYNRKGNFDRVMAFMMLMFSINEEEEGKEYGGEDKETAIENQLMEMMIRQFNNNKTALNA